MRFNLSFPLKEISKYKPPGGGLYLEGRFNGGFFALRAWGLIFGGAYFRNFTVLYHFKTTYSIISKPLIKLHKELKHAVQSHQIMRQFSLA